MQNPFGRRVDQQFASVNVVLKQSIDQSDAFIQQAFSQAAWLQLELALDYWAGEIEFRTLGKCAAAPDFFPWLNDQSMQYAEHEQLNNLLLESGWLAQTQWAVNELRKVDQSASIKGDFFSTEEKAESHIIAANSAYSDKPWRDPVWVQSIAREFYDAVCLLRTAADEF